MAARREWAHVKIGLKVGLLLRTTTVCRGAVEKWTPQINSLFGGFNCAAGEAGRVQTERGDGVGGG